MINEIKIPPVIVLKDGYNGLMVSSIQFFDEKYTSIIRKIEDAYRDSNKTILDIQSIFFNEVTPIKEYYDFFVGQSWYGSQTWGDGLKKPEKYTNATYKDALMRKCKEWSHSDLISVERHLKERYTNQCIAYIHYQTLYEMYQKLSTDPSVHLFSKEERGVLDGCGMQKWSVTDDLEVCIETNFCYGSASYFYLTISYKGFVIPSFSLFTKYFNVSDKFTEKTLCLSLRRDAWTPALEFVKKIVVQYRCEQDPERFVYGYIKGEIEGMMNGLRFIVSKPHDFIRLFVEEYNLNKNESDVTKWKLDYKKVFDYKNLCVNPISSSEVSDFEKYPSEMSLVLKADKLSQVARTLKYLRGIVDVCPWATDYIKEICEMIASVIPEVQDMIDVLSDKIQFLQELFECKDNECKIFWKRMEKYVNELNQLLFNLPPDSYNRDSDKVRETYDKEHPDYVSLREKYYEIDAQRIKLRVELDARNKFKEHLYSFLTQCKLNSVLQEPS